MAHAVLMPRRGAPRGLMTPLPASGAMDTEAALTTLPMGVRARPAPPWLMVGPPVHCA